MKLLIHDLSKEQAEALISGHTGEFTIISDDGTIRQCIGCFGCWVKTPGVCVIPDHYQKMGEFLSKSDETMIISRCCYGGFSPFVKNVLDRSISYVHPYFETRNGEMHHKRRYVHEIKLKVWFYGDTITLAERQTAEKLLQANSVNLAANGFEVHFVKEPAQINLNQVQTKGLNQSKHWPRRL